jgi:hypothetical protein
VIIFNDVVCGLVPYYNIDIEIHAFFIICPKPYIHFGRQNEK